MITHLHTKYETIDEIYYQTEIGILFKNKLKITSTGITWKGQHYLNDQITKIRWGWETSSLNGISLGADYTIALGDDRTEAVIFLRSQKKYDIILNILWKSVCVPLILDILKQVTSGKEIEFGTAIHKVRLENDGLTLIHQNRSHTVSTKCTWQQLYIQSLNGSFYIGSLEDKQKYCRLSYLNTPNVHILEQIIRATQNQPQLKLLNELIDN